MTPCTRAAICRPELPNAHRRDLSDASSMTVCVDTDLQEGIADAVDP